MLNYIFYINAAAFSANSAVVPFVVVAFFADQFAVAAFVAGVPYYVAVAHNLPDHSSVAACVALAVGRFETDYLLQLTQRTV